MCFTRSTSALNECGSFTANSAKIFRSTHTFSRPNPLINSLYLTCIRKTKRAQSVARQTSIETTTHERTPCARAAATTPRRTPCSLVAALILVIHNRRQSRFLFRRSRYWYCQDFSTRFLAIVMQFFARPRMPLAAANIFSRTVISSNAASASSSSSRTAVGGGSGARVLRCRVCSSTIPH